MKERSCVGLSLATFGAFALCVSRADAAEGSQIVERGAHHRVIQNVSQITRLDGNVVSRTNSYTELGTGLCYFKDGAWRDTNPRFSLFPGGAVAQEGPFQVIITPDVAQEGAVDVLSPSGKRFVSSPRWLAYYNRQTGQSAMVAAIKSCIGQLTEQHVIVFADAFDDLKAALRYTYQPGGIEQEVILLESGPLRPQDYGLNGNDEDFVLEMWSEFLTWPEPTRTIAVAQEELDDVTLEFGEARMGMGRAFWLGDEQNSVAVGKSWLNVDRRQFLVEAVRQSDLAPLLARLPQQAQARNPQRAQALARNQKKAVLGRAALLAAGQDRLKVRTKRTQLAAIEPSLIRLPAYGASIDYSIMTSVSNLVLRCDTTYYVSNSVTLSGTTVIQGGAVLKLANATNANKIIITGPIDCLTSLYRPAVFTSKDDDTIGQLLDVSSGNQNIGTNHYGGRALDLNAASTTYNLHDLRFRYSDTAIYVSASSASLNLTNAQIGNANVAINNAYPSGTARNVLIHDCATAISSASGGTNRLEHATLHRVGTFRSNGTVYLTNSLLICVTNSVSYTGSNVETNLSEVGVFQILGAGERYLSGSKYRNAGTSVINPGLLAEIRRGTTYPPIFLTNVIDLNVTLSRQVQRDTDIPDLGYHYPATDYVLLNCPATNDAVITIAPGTVIGWCSSGAFWLQDTCTLICEGTPLQRNQFVRFNAVQERSTNWGGSVAGSGWSSTLTINAHCFANPAPTVRLRFTDFNGLASHRNELYVDGLYWIINPLTVKDCTFNATPLEIVTCPTGSSTVTLINNTFEGGWLTFGGDPTISAYNNHFVGGSQCMFDKNGSSPWIFRDNIFADTTIYDEGGVTHDHNGYINTSGRLTPDQATDKVLASLAFDIGPLGRFYQPTNSTLLDAGSRYATNAGLAFFTTTTNQTKEASWVDIGAHYPALNSQWTSVLDTDSDSMLDVVEDANNNGSYDTGETDWQTYNSLFGLGAGGPGLVVFTPLK